MVILKDWGEAFRLFGLRVGIVLHKIRFAFLETLWLQGGEGVWVGGKWED